MRKFLCYSVVTSFLFLSVICSSQNGAEMDIKCILPEHPKNGLWKILPESKGNPGDFRYNDTVLEFSCNEGYKLSHFKLVLCEKNWNEANLPTCLRKCPPLHSTREKTLSCTDKHGRKVECSDAADGTDLTFDCKPYYEQPSHLSRSFSCRDGSWTSSPICLPFCGIAKEEDQLTFESHMKTDTTFPWHASIFAKYGRDEYINVCGGTIISTNLVVTAAHCLTIEEFHKTLPVENVSIAVGTLNSIHDYSHHNEGQYYKVQKIATHPSYRGDIRRYIGDIAVIVSKELFIWSPTVLPICIRDVIDIPLRIGSVGKIAGWEISKDGTPTKKQKVLEIPYKDQEKCIRELPEDFELKYNMDGKMCAGLYGRNSSVCRFTSGNGLVFKNNEDNRYYIHGILSVGPKNWNSQCIFEDNSLYSSIAFYYNFIEALIAENGEDQCLLPNYPVNGTYMVQNHEDSIPRNIVSPYSVLNVHCNKGCTTFSKVVRMRCEYANNMPKCICK